MKARGPKQRLAWFTPPPEADLFGGEIVLAGERVLGRITSAGYGYTVGRNLCCAYLATSEADYAGYAVEAMGERFAAVRHSHPLYHPDRRAIHAE